jgi:1,4-dihydroxy-2-naphthoate octaprenyltransferase/chlorophyll synthase
MASAVMTTFERWRFALKPASWPKLLVPFVLGQAIGIDATGRFSPIGFLLALAFTAADAVFVVTLNDFGDREVDAIKRRMFPRTSQKTIPDGVLAASSLLFAGVGAAIVAMAIALFALAFDRPLAPIVALLALALFVAYTLPPLRLNYRGGGELLEALGVGIVLPWLSAYLQSGHVWMPALDSLGGFALLALASAVASGLSDERSDREGGKRTVVTLIGNARARTMVLTCLAFGSFAWFGAAAIPRGTPTIALVGAAFTALLAFPSLHQASASAITDAFDAHSRFKTMLHRAIWESALCLAIVLTIAPWIGL